MRVARDDKKKKRKQAFDKHREEDVAVKQQKRREGKTGYERRDPDVSVLCFSFEKKFNLFFLLIHLVIL